MNLDSTYNNTKTVVVITTMAACWAITIVTRRWVAVLWLARSQMSSLPQTVNLICWEWQQTSWASPMTIKTITIIVASYKIKMAVATTLLTASKSNCWETPSMLQVWAKSSICRGRKSPWKTFRVGESTERTWITTAAAIFTASWGSSNSIRTILKMVGMRAASNLFKINNRLLMQTSTIQLSLNSSVKLSH